MTNQEKIKLLNKLKEKSKLIKNEKSDNPSFENWKNIP